MPLIQGAAAGVPGFSPPMILRLRKLLTSVPSITVVGLLSAYLLVGFFALPAVLRWQLEKQFADRGYLLQVGDLRLDPWRLRLEVDNLSLAPTTGAKLLAFDNLMLDLQWRSIIDRTWTIADSRLEALTLRFDRAKDGGNNIGDLLATFGPAPQDRSAKDDTITLPPLQVQRFVLTQGQVEWLDQKLEQPLVSRVTSLQAELHQLSTRGSPVGRYRFSARTEAGESLQLHGEAGIAARRASGQWALRALRVATLARGWNREIALQSPRGRLDSRGSFDLSLDADDTWIGGARDVQLAVSELFLQPPGAHPPLLDARQLSLRGGRLDLAQRAWHIDALQLVDASANADIDAQGTGSWSGVLRQGGTADRTAQGPAAASAFSADGTAAGRGAIVGGVAAPAAPGPAAVASWGVSIAEIRIDRVALALRDAARQRSLTVAELSLDTALDATVGGTMLADVQLPQLRSMVNGLTLQQGEASVRVPSTQLEAGAVQAQADSARLDATLDAVKLTWAQGFSLDRGVQSASVDSGTLAVAGIRSRGSSEGSRLELDSPRWQLRSLQARARGQSARVGRLDVGGGKLVLDAGSGANGMASTMTLALDKPRLQLDQIAADSGTGILSANPDDRATAARDTEPSASRPNATASLRAASTDARHAGTSVRLAQLGMQAQQLSVALDSADNRVVLDNLQSQMRDLSLQANEQTVTLARLSLDQERLTVRQGTAGVQLQAQAPVLRLQGIDARRGAQRAELAKLQLQGSRIDISTGGSTGSTGSTCSTESTYSIGSIGSIGSMRLRWSDLQGSGDQLSWARNTDRLQLVRLALGGGNLGLVMTSDAAVFSGTDLNAESSDAQVAQKGHRLALGQARWQLRSVEARLDRVSGTARISARIADSAFSLTSLALSRIAEPSTAADASGSSARELATLASATGSAGELAMDVTDAPLQLRGKAMALQLQQAVLQDPTRPDTA